MIGLCVLVLAVMAGCAPARFSAAPQLQDRVRSIKTVAVMPPNIKVYQVSVGGSTQLMDDLTAAATQHVAKAIEEKLKGQSGVVFTPFPSPSALPDIGSSPEVAALKDELEDTQALFEAVNGSVIPHATKNIYVPGQRFPEKFKNFDYSLGPDVQRLAKLASADALLFISGVDNFSTGGRRILMGLETVLKATAEVAAQQAAFAATAPSSLPSVGSMAGPMTAGEAAKSAVHTVGTSASGEAGQSAAHTVGGARWGITSLSAALVDGETGAILWYDVAGFRAWSSLTDSHNAADLVEEVLADFPVSGKPLQKD